MYNSEFRNYLSEQLNIAPEVIRELFQDANDNEFKVAWYLINDYKVDKSELGKVWGNYLGFAYVDPSTSIVNPEYISRLGAKFITENKALPLYKFGRAVTVSSSNPDNPFLQGNLEKKLGEIVSLVFCFPFDIESYIQMNNIR